MDAATPGRPLRAGTAALLWAVLAHLGAGWLVLRQLAAIDVVQTATAVTPVQLVAPHTPHATAPTPAPSPGPKVAPPQPKAALSDAAAEVLFRSPRELDRPALPRSSPDISTLAGLPWSGLPMRLRLFVDANGAVVDVRVLLSHEDEEVVERVRRMFLSTAFIAGRVQGRDVASYKDVELTLGPR